MRKSLQKPIAATMGYLNLIIHNLVSFVLTPIMILTWGDGNYGLYKIILSLMSYFLLVDAGIKNSVIRFVSEYRSKNDRSNARKYVGTIIGFYVVASLFLAVVVTVFSQFVPTIFAKSLTAIEQSILVKSLPLLLIYTIGTLYFNCFSAIIRGYNKQIIIQSINILRSVIRFWIVFFMLKAQYSVIQVIGADAIISVLFAFVVIGYVFFALRIPPKFSGISKHFIKGIVAFSGVMLIYTIANSLFWSIDNLIVSIMTSSVIAAVYTTSVTLTNMFQSLSSAVSQVMVPDIMLRDFSSNNKRELDQLMIRVGKIKMYIMLLILIGFGVFGKDFVILWVGNGYIDTYVIAFIIMIPLFFGLIQDVPMNIMLTRNKHKTMAIITMVAALINIFASVVLIKLFGIYGVAVGTAIAYTSVYIIFTYSYFTKELGFNMKLFYREVILNNSIFIIICIAIAIAVRFLPVGGWIGLIVKALTFTAIYCILIATLSKDKDKIMTYLYKIRGLR